jgi:hypothetical protein
MFESVLETPSAWRRSRVHRVLRTSAILLLLSILLEIMGPVERFFGISMDDVNSMSFMLPCMVALAVGCLLMLGRFKHGLEATAELGLVLFESAWTVIAFVVLAIGALLALSLL